MAEDFSVNARLNASQMITQLKQINTTLTKTNSLLMATHSKTRTANQGLNRVGTGAKKTGGMFGGLGKQLRGSMMQFIGLNMAIGFGVGKLKEAFTWAYNTKDAFRSWEEAIANVSTIIVDLGDNSLPRLSSGIEILSVRWGKSVEDLSKGMYDILSAAFGTRDALNLLTTATKAAIAGITSVSKSVDVFTSILNAYGMSVYQATSLSDQLFQTVVRGKLTYEDLSNAMGYIAPIAANLGVEFKEIAAALSTVTRQGQHLDMATRGLALGIQNIADLSPKAAKAAQKYGVDLSATTLRVGGLKAILIDLNKAMKEHGAKILPEMVANMRSLRVFMALTGKEGIGGFIKDLNLLDEAAGRTEEALAKVAATSKMEADIMEQSMKRLERSIGEAWHDIDIWWSKAKLWWGTLLTGGDASKAVKNYEDRIRELRNAQLEMLGTSVRLAEMKPLDIEVMKHLEYTSSSAEDLTRKYETLSDAGVDVETILKGGLGGLKAYASGMNIVKKSGGDLEEDWKALGTTFRDWHKALRTDISQVIAINVDWEGVEKYLIASKKAEEYAERAYSYGTLTRQIEGILNKSEDMRKEFGLSADEWKLIGKTTQVANMDMSRMDTIVEHLNKQLKEMKLPTIDPMGDWATGDESISHTQQLLNYLSGEYDNLKTSMDTENTTAEGTIEAFNLLAGAMDNLVQLGQNTQLNIIDLKNSLKELDFQLHDAYKTMSEVEGMETFGGKLTWEVQVAGLETSLSRFKRYSDMAIKYGDTMRTDFMSEINKLNSELGGVDLNIEWFNETIFNMVEGVDTLGYSMGELIDNLSNLTGRMKELDEQGEVITRFKKLGDLAIDYGGNFTTTFEDLIKEVSDFNFNIEMSSEFQEEFGSSLEEIIKTLHDYTEAEKKAKEEQKAMNDALDEQNKLLDKNNLKIQKIQLQGMMRRRGLTRAEERVIKRIRIENLEIRIAMTEQEMENEEKATNEILDETEERYETAKELYEEYIDKMNYIQDEMVRNTKREMDNLNNIYNEYLVRYNLYLADIKDGDDSNLENKIRNIGAQEALYNKYQIYLDREVETLENVSTSINEIAKEIDDSPAAEAWETYFQMTAVEQYRDNLLQIRDFLIEIKNLGGGGGASSGGGGATPDTGGATRPRRDDDDDDDDDALSGNRALAIPATAQEFIVRGVRSEARSLVDEMKRVMQLKSGSRGLARGTHYVPETMPTIVHKGEQIILPGGRGGGRDTINITNNINAVIKDDYSVERLASQLGAAMQSKLLTKRGKSKFRMR